MTIEDQAREISGAEGIDFFGVADLGPARDAIAAQGGPEIARCPRAVAIGMTLVHTIVDRLSVPVDAQAAELYRYYCYDLVNDRLDKAALRIALALQADGFGALPVPAAPRAIDPDRLCGIFSSKMAAHLAGLGWIGRSCLLVTPEAGPRVRWAAVLTDAPLQETGTPMAPGDSPGAKYGECGECRACVEVCPAQAFTGRAFRADEGREARYHAEACSAYVRRVKEETGHRVCGMCLKVCPHGVKAARRARE